MIRSAKNYFKTSDDVQLYYEDYGQGSPIVLLHGFCGSSRFFQRNIEGLSKSHRLILLDLRGHGSSMKVLEGVNFKRMAADVNELIEFLHLENVTLLAWSMGSNVVLTYWKFYAGYGHVRRLGILDSTLFPFSPDEWNYHGLRSYNMDAANARLQGMMADPASDAQRMVEGMSNSETKEEDKAWMREEIMKTPPYIAYSMYSYALAEDFTEYIRSVTVPVLFMGSESAAVKGIVAAKYYMSKCRSACELVTFPEGSHFFFYLYPEKFNDAVCDFISRYPEKDGQTL